ncbi:MAG: ComF family protein [Alphaproteobacteria bacterium]|nr:ComF family protein [Alphaproteobacteria bacterium]
MKAFHLFLDMILPPRCIVSGEIVDRQGLISPQIWGQLNFITDPQCNRCGFPFDFDTGDVREGNICLGCLQSPPLFDKARAALVYDDVSRDIILGFKHGDQTEAVPAFIPWLRQAGQSLLKQSDYIMPVPLHRWRILRRRFNQSALIAKYLSEDTKIPMMLDGVLRQRATVTQGHLNSNERQKNVKNAFVVHPKRAESLKGKTVILIDDVYTTGATVNECTKVLLKAGVSAVNILTLARVVKPQRS